VVPIGGGGLIAGIAVAIKETNPRIKVYGVEADGDAGYEGASRPPDGRSPSRPRARWPMASRWVAWAISHTPSSPSYVDDIVTVDDEEMASAILTLLEVEKAVVEAAGAVPLAAIANGRLPIDGRKVALLCSGGNIDVTVLSRIIERGLVKDGRMVRMWATIADSPGSLARFADILARLSGQRGRDRPRPRVHAQPAWAPPGSP
jgi:threonine dehydratase